MNKMKSMDKGILILNADVQSYWSNYRPYPYPRI